MEDVAGPQKGAIIKHPYRKHGCSSFLKNPQLILKPQQTARINLSDTLRTNTSGSELTNVVEPGQPVYFKRQSCI